MNADYVLHIQASPRGQLSESTALGRVLTRQISRKFPALAVVERDLGSNRSFALDAQFAADNLLPLEARSPAAISDELIDELVQAKALIITTPMHNFSVPSVLKAWIDQVMRPQQTFDRTAEGKVGLLSDRPVFIIITSGGPVTGPYAQQDFLRPYLEYTLRVMGLSDVRVMRADGLLRNPEHAAVQIGKCKEWISEQVHSLGSLNPTMSA